MSWSTPDVEGLIEQLRALRETMSGGVSGGTTSANVGPYEVPLGGVLRQPDVTGMNSDSTPTPEIPIAGYKKRAKR